MANTFIKIASVTVGAGGASSIDFTSIPSTYTDLVLLTSTRNNASNEAGEQAIQFNNSSSNLSNRVIYGTGSATGSYATTNAIPAYNNGATSTSNSFNNATYYIPNYAGSTNKSVSSESVFENNATYAAQYIVAGLWSNSAAITSIKLLTSNNATGASANFVQYSTATLYGIKKN